MAIPMVEATSGFLWALQGLSRGFLGAISGLCGAYVGLGLAFSLLRMNINSNKGKSCQAEKYSRTSDLP